jgi:hypothetical protein
MKTSSWWKPCGRIHVADRGGITLVEVLVAIFIIGVGLLALLTLFPLGALELAQAIKDDRAGTIATEARVLGEAGLELLGRTSEFLDEASQGNVDRQEAAALEVKFQDLAEAATIIEMQLLELRPSVPKRRVRPKVEVLLAQARAIERGLRSMSTLFGTLAEGDTSPNQ